jgi:hypothetical protein
MSKIVKDMNYDTVKELLEAHTTAINGKNQAGYDMLSYKIDELICRQDKMNGRVNCLEKDTKFARLVQEYPKISTFVFLVVIISVGSFGINEIIQWVKIIF